MFLGMHRDAPCMDNLHQYINTLRCAPLARWILPFPSVQVVSRNEGVDTAMVEPSAAEWVEKAEFRFQLLVQFEAVGRW